MAQTLGRKPGEKLYIVDEDGKEIEIEVVQTQNWIITCVCGSTRQRSTKLSGEN
ncbi:hypothetical protein [Thalassobacillus devorans]|uniref:hypothetical protein n=1 Tax=Thalassobacillus devorans TaxID=279813 RepID=UPI0004B4BA95|nr:hypothetical protein [Thalassobacillus devorans]